MKPALKIVLWSAVVLAVIVAAAAPKVFHPSGEGARAPQSAMRPGDGEKKEDNPLPVSTVTVTPSPLAETISSTGTLLAEESVELQAEINGKVSGISFKEGVHVRKGELLVKLNDADLLASRARAHYRRELAQLREQRFAKLLKQGVARQEEYDTALNELNVQEAEIDLINAQIAKTEIRAPFDGVVGLRFVSEGAYVSAATRVATLQRLDRLKVDFSVPEKYAVRLRAGSPITFVVAGASERFVGEIYAVEPRIDVATRTVLVRAVCPNQHGKVLPGAFASIELTLGQLKDAILIPSVAVVPGLDEKNVYVLIEGKAERRPVQTGTRLQSSVQILSGLAPGEVVITSGLSQMRPGLSVRARDSESVAQERS